MFGGVGWYANGAEVRWVFDNDTACTVLIRWSSSQGWGREGTLEPCWPARNAGCQGHWQQTAVAPLPASVQSLHLCTSLHC